MKVLMPNGLPLLPELFEVILDYLSPLELYTLLTVNKYFLRVCAKRLYSNPVETLISLKQKHQQRAVERFLVLILRFSPATDNDVQDLRTHFHQELAVLPVTPTINYLDLIKSMTYNEALFGPGSSVAQKVPYVCPGDLPHSMHLYATIAFAACGHRLLAVRDLLIPCRDLGRYLQLVGEMTAMRSITLHLNDAPEGEPQVWEADEIDQVLQDLGLTLTFMTSWQAAYKEQQNDGSGPVYIGLTGGVSLKPWWTWEPIAHTLEAIFRLMPLSVIPFLDYHERLEWARFVLAPNTIDLSRVLAIESYELSQEYGTLLWPNLGISSVLRQCPSLRQLGVALGEVDDDAFAWAVQEKRQALSQSHYSCHLPRLEHLVLSLRGHWPKIHPWSDSLFAFGVSLKQLTIDDPYACHTIDLCTVHGLPNLAHVKLRVRAFAFNGPSLPFSGCPQLETVTLANLEWNSDPVRPWSLPSVSILDLSGPIGYQYDQATLTTMPKLEQFRLLNQAAAEQVGPIPQPFTWEQNYWSPSRLRVLQLFGAMARAFRWTMLARCPCLQLLSLTDTLDEAATGGDGAGGEGGGARLVALHMDASNPPDVVATSLRALALRGWSISREDLLNHLPRMFPNLQALDVRSCGMFSKEEQEMLKAAFPLLRNLDIS